MLPHAAPPHPPQETQDLTFSGRRSVDPDDRPNRTPFRFAWTCTAVDASTQVPPCAGGRQSRRRAACLVPLDVRTGPLTIAPPRSRLSSCFAGCHVRTAQIWASSALPLLQVSAPCFASPAAAGIDLTSSQLVIPRGALPASNGTYRIALTAAKYGATQNRSDSDEAVIRVLAVAAPTCRAE